MRLTGPTANDECGSFASLEMDAAQAKLAFQAISERYGGVMYPCRMAILDEIEQRAIDAALEQDVTVDPRLGAPARHARARYAACMTRKARADRC